jgi:serine protease Do
MVACQYRLPFRQILAVCLACILSQTLIVQAQTAGGAKLSTDPSTVDLVNLQSQFRAVADRVSPSVVAISSAVSANNQDDAARVEGLNSDKLENILERTTRIVGTGFVIDADGFILTNEHVIGDAMQAWVTTDDRKVYPAIVIGSDPRADLAVLKIPARNLPPVKFAAPEAARRGNWAIALGNPYGLAAAGEMSMSVGVVSAINRALPKLASQEDRYYSNLIQTTAEINPGSSGGPLFNLNGEVMGISTAVIMPQKTTNGIGFAMPITPDLLARVADLKAGREVVYAYLGVMVSQASARQRRTANITDNTGVWVDLVEKESPAGDGLQIGDIVTRVNDRAVSESDEFIRIVGQSSLAHPARFTIHRDGKELAVAIQLKRRELTTAAVDRDNQRMRWQGMLLGPIPANWDFGTIKRPPHGVMVLGIDPASPMSKDIRSGAVITAVAGKPVNGLIDFQNILNSTPAEQCSLEIAPQPQRPQVLAGKAQ